MQPNTLTGVIILGVLALCWLWMILRRRAQERELERRIAEIHERMEQFVGVDMPIKARYKIERVHTHGEDHTETMRRIWPSEPGEEKRETFFDYSDHSNN